MFYDEVQKGHELLNYWLKN